MVIIDHSEDIPKQKNKKKNKKIKSNIAVSEDFTHKNYLSDKNI